DRDPAIAGGLDQIVDDEEIAGIPRAGDDIELVVEALLDRRWQRIAVTLPGAMAREMDEEILVGREFRRARILRQEVALLEVELAQIRDAGGLGQRVL